MQIDGDNAINARYRDEVCDQPRGDWLARSGLAFLSRIAVMRDDGTDRPRRRTLCGISHDEQLHEGIVDIATGTRTHGLNDKHIGATHTFQVPGVNLAVRELLELDVAERLAQLVSDSICKRLVHRSGENRHCLMHPCCHTVLLVLPSRPTVRVSCLLNHGCNPLIWPFWQILHYSHHPREKPAQASQGAFKATFNAVRAMHGQMASISTFVSSQTTLVRYSDRVIYFSRMESHERDRAT